MVIRKTKNDTPKAAKAGHNGFDPDVLKVIVNRIESLHRDLDSERGSYMATCKSKREDIADVYEEGKARGIPTKELKKAVKARELARKIEALREDLDDMVQRDTYDQIRHALGDLADTPLGAAAAAGAPGAPGEDDDIRPGFLKDRGDDPDADAAAANAEKLKGIKPLKGAEATGSYTAAH